jgi:isopentenyldiphosphate isomerase
VSADELVDVVDEADRVLGQATRADVRARHLRHRSVFVFVFNSQGQLLVHRRTPTKDVFPDHWDLAVGGVLAAGEAYDAGARRELSEEVGIGGVQLRRLFPFRYDDDRNHIVATVYSCTWDGELRLQTEEIVSAEWLDLDAVFERVQQQSFCPDSLEAFRQYLARLETVRRQR